MGIVPILFRKSFQDNPEPPDGPDPLLLIVMLVVVGGIVGFAILADWLWVHFMG